MDDGDLSLHNESRRVYCVDCLRETPAFDALKKLAGEWERYKNHRDQARTDAKRAQERLDDLKRQEANTRSRLRTVRAKLAKTDPTWAALDKLAHDPRRYISVESLRAVLYAEQGEIQEAQGGI